MSDLSAAELNTEDGLDLLLSKLDLVFQSKTIDEAYDIYTKFITFTRSDEMNMNEYILEYEHLNLKMNEHKMKLPDAVFTFKLLDGARITSEERKLALTMSGELNFLKMKSALKGLFIITPSIADRLFTIKSSSTKDQRFHRSLQVRN